MKQKQVVELMEQMNQLKNKIPALETKFKINDAILELGVNNDYKITSWRITGIERLTDEAVNRLQRAIDFREKFNNNEIDVEGFNTMLKGILNIEGFQVTIPFKDKENDSDKTV